MKRAAYILVAVLAAETAAAQDVPSPPPPPPLAVVREGRVVQMMPGSCDGKEQPAAVESVVGALVGFAADFVVGWIGKSIEAHNKGYTGSFLATGVSSVASGPACLRVYRGPIGVGGIPAPEAARGTAAFYLESDVKITRAADKANWTVTPWNLSYRTSVATTKSKTKNVTVVVSLVDTTPTPAAAKDEGKVLAVFRHDLGELEVGKSYNAGLLSGSESANAVGGLGTYNVAVLVTESREPGPAMQALASSFNDNKSELSGALADVIKSAVGEKK